MNKEYFNGALDFFHFIKKYKIDLSYPEIENIQAKLHLNDFTNLVLDSNMSYIDSSIELSVSRVYDLATQILYIMYGQTYSDLEINNLKSKIAIVGGSNPFEGSVGYLGNNKCIFLECANSNYSVPTITHEGTHFLIPLKYTPNYHQTETLPILTEFITSIILDGMNIGSENFDTIILERFIALKKRIEDKIKYTIIRDDMLNINTLEQKQLIYVYASNIAYTYLLSTIYAINLLEYYQEDALKFISKLNKTLNQKNGIEELINYYNIDLSKSKTFDEPIRILNNHQ